MKYNLEPVFDENSKILILGSFPSEVSRKYGFYYMKPQNRFWKVLSKIFNCEILETKEDRIKFLLKHNIAIYDAISSCDIEGSSDNKITNITPSNLDPIFNKAKIVQVFANGTKAYEICEKYLKDQIVERTKKDIIKLPSTSPANARFNLDKLTDEWKVITSAL